MLAIKQILYTLKFKPPESLPVQNLSRRALLYRLITSRYHTGRPTTACLRLHRGAGEFLKGHLEHEIDRATTTQELMQNLAQLPKSGRLE